MQLVMWPFGYKKSHTSGEGGSVLNIFWGFGPFKVCTGSDVSGASLWSEPTIFNCKGCLHCVLPAMNVLIHASTSFQESLGVPHNPQRVLPPQDCCTFWLVPSCTTEESRDRLWTSVSHITRVLKNLVPNVIALYMSCTEEFQGINFFFIFIFIKHSNYK